MDNDLGWADLVKRLTDEVRVSNVKVGVIGQAAGVKREGGISNAGLAAIHEFGTEKAGINRNVTIPERRPLRTAFDENRSAYEQKTIALVRDIIDGRVTVKRGLEQAGLRMVADIKNTIRRGLPPPNADSVREEKERKGARSGSPSTDPSKTLIDTGAYINSFTHAVATGQRQLPRGDR